MSEVRGTVCALCTLKICSERGCSCGIPGSLEPGCCKRMGRNSCINSKSKAGSRPVKQVSKPENKTIEVEAVEAEINHCQFNEQVTMKYKIPTAEGVVVPDLKMGTGDESGASVRRIFMIEGMDEDTLVGLMNGFFESGVICVLGAMKKYAPKYKGINSEAVDDIKNLTIFEDDFGTRDSNGELTDFAIAVLPKVLDWPGHVMFFSSDFIMKMTNFVERCELDDSGSEELLSSFLKRVCRSTPTLEIVQENMRSFNDRIQRKFIKVDFEMRLKFEVIEDGETTPHIFHITTTPLDHIAVATTKFLNHPKCGGEQVLSFLKKRTVGSEILMEKHKSPAMKLFKQEAFAQQNISTMVMQTIFVGMILYRPDIFSHKFADGLWKHMPCALKLAFANLHKYFYKTSELLFPHTPLTDNPRRTATVRPSNGNLHLYIRDYQNGKQFYLQRKQRGRLAAKN